MIRIAIVEDNEKDQMRLTACLQKYAAAYHEQFDIVSFANGVEFFNHYKKGFDILFLDIDMEHLSGIEVAQRIRRTDAVVAIIFTTNLLNYAIKGYEVGAMDYLLKPIRYEVLESRVTKALQICKKNRNEELVFKVGNDFVRLSMKDIRYIEVVGHKLIIHCFGNTYETWNVTLSSVEKSLAGTSFSRCSASYLVNLMYVSAIDKNVVRLDGETIPISRSRREQFLADLSDYLCVIR